MPPTRSSQLLVAAEVSDASALERPSVIFESPIHLVLIAMRSLAVLEYFQELDGRMADEGPFDLVT
jgi:hypothetical protein